VAAVKVAQAVGYNSVVAMARRAGLNGNIMATPAVALGAYDVTPLEMAGAYTVFANGGTWVKPQMVSSVRDASGEVVRSFDAETRPALDPRVAYLMTSMLEEVMRSGTAAGVRARGFTVPAAGKTGTSHDGWFAGYTSQLLCVVWVGFDDYTELNLEGAKSALPIWTEFMKRASKFSAYRNPKEFQAPRGIVSAKVCTDSGKLAGDLCSNTRNELFIAGTDPTDVCDQHSFQYEIAPPGAGSSLPATAAAAPVISTTPMPISTAAGNNVPQ
jgi:penicillin-binding protein 1B